MMIQHKLVAWAVGLCLTLPVSAQVVNAHANGQVADMVCPVVKRTPPKPAKANSATTAPQPVEEGVLEPPAPDELMTMPAEDSEAAQHLLLQANAARKSADHPLSIAFWGDSHLAANFFGDELVRLSGLPRQKVLPTFIPATMGRAGVRLPIRKYCQGGGWASKLAYVSKETSAPFSQGLSLLAASTPNSYLWVDFRLGSQEPALRAVDVAYQLPGEGHAVLGVIVDDGEEQIVALDSVSNGLLQIRADQAMSRLKLRLIEGSVALEGFAPQYLEQAPGLILDTFAIPGAMVRGWTVADPDYIKQRLGNRTYDIVVMEYGTNEGNSKQYSTAAYRNDLRAALANMRRVFPDAQCILMGPADRGVLVRHVKVKVTHAKAKSKAKGKDKGKSRGKEKVVEERIVKVPPQDLLKYARIHQDIGNVQREVGAEFGCSYWSWQDEMGGPGGVYRWFYHSPQLMSKDLTHLTIPGYQLTARMFAESIQFQNWISQGTRSQ